MRRRGFSLIEFLLVLGLSFLVFLAAFESFGITRSLFLKIKSAEEDSLAIQAALGKLRMDLLRAGFGLDLPVAAGVVEGIAAADRLVLLSLEDRYLLASDCAARENRVTLEKTTGLSVGRAVCLADEEKAERRTVSALEGQTVVLAEPLENSYSTTDAGLLLLEEVSYYLDEQNSVLRRKVNASPAQPLLDAAGLFEFAYAKEANLVSVKLADKKNMERAHGFTIFPKNLGLILPRAPQE
jgi:hypothetical protein